MTHRRKNTKTKKLLKVAADLLKSDINIWAGSAAFKFILSVIPLASVLTVAFSGTPDAMDWLLEFSQSLLAPQAHSFVKYISSIAQQNTTVSVFSFSMVTLLYTASSGVYSLLISISLANRTENEKPRNPLFMRGLALGFTIILLLLAALLVIPASALEQKLSPYTIRIFRYTAVFAILLALLFFSYKFAPAKKLRSRTAIVEAFISCILIGLAALIIKIYYSISGFNSVYGTFAGIVIVMILIYMIAWCVIAVASVFTLWQKYSYPPNK